MRGGGGCCRLRVALNSEWLPYKYVLFPQMYCGVLCFIFSILVYVAFLYKYWKKLSTLSFFRLV